METTNIEATDPRWRVLYQFGGAAALSMVAIIVIQLIVFITVPPPLEGTAIDWFRLFQGNRLIGLIDFELLMIVYTILAIPLTLALYFALRQTNQAFAAFFVLLSLTGVMCFIAARPAFEMLYLSNQFAAATTEAQKAAFLAAGEAKLATFHGTAFQISYLLGSINGVIVSFVMLQSKIFSRATAYVRLGSSVFDFGLYVPVIGTFLSIFSVLFLFAWNIMVARRLFQLARSSSSQVSSA
ncbi:MAG: DUF4386 family protein [Chloroflexi bacterium]|nr:MAG: DUF4386 family protein [Chloroflexota bacterium]